MAMAKEFGVKLVMYGENQAEYGNAIKENSVNHEHGFSSENPQEMLFGGVKMKTHRWKIFS